MDHLLLAWQELEPRAPATTAMADEEVTVVVWLQKLEHLLHQWCRHNQLKRSNVSFADEIKSCNPLSYPLELPTELPSSSS